MEIKSNLSLVARERGKIVALREGHNIWLNTGRTWLSKLMSATSFGPVVPQEDQRVRYIGFGIGGGAQSNASMVSSPPLVDHYPGTNTNTDHDPAVLRLERPVRLSWAAGPSTPTGTYPALTYDPGDVWLRQVSAPATHPQTTTTRVHVTLAGGDVSSGPFSYLPLSEIGLFPNGADPNLFNNAPLAYDTFEPLPKTASITIDIFWTIRF